MAEENSARIQTINAIGKDYSILVYPLKYVIACVGDDRPLLKDLHDHVVRDVACKWNYLGVQLLRPDQQKELDIIEKDHPRDAVECCKCALKKWLDTTPSATWNQLISALRSPTVQLDHLSTQIEKIMIVEVRFVIVLVKRVLVHGKKFQNGSTNSSSDRRDNESVKIY